jgi:uncharacterized protein YutE (UPF0331/DUF86 family)
MTPGAVSERVILDRLALIEKLLRAIRSLPLDEEGTFQSDPRNVGAAESFLRRSLEALLDIGRHVLAKAFASPVSEYRAIGSELERRQVLDAEQGELLRTLAGYRNRLVHFYDEITPSELFEICTHRLSDIERVADGFRSWLREHSSDRR